MSGRCQILICEGLLLSRIEKSIELGFSCI